MLITFIRHNYNSTRYYLYKITKSLSQLCGSPLKKNKTSYPSFINKTGTKAPNARHTPQTAAKKEIILNSK